MKVEELCHQMGRWLDGTGPRAEIVLSSRVRLARNLREIPFPHRADESQRRRVLDEVRDACRETESLSAASIWDLEEISDRDRRILVERQLASANLARASGARGVVVGPGERRGAMINEEDHVRIQSVTSGLNLQEALDRAIQVDRDLERRLDYAVSPKHGYLTACPTNVGTGLRASVLIHLPALALAHEVKKVHQSVAEMGMVVRGWFGEGSGALGDYYQLSNQRTLGKTEQEATGELGRVTERVLALETEARERLRKNTPKRRILEDRIFRALGTLREARLLTVEQVMACASDVRLGKWLGFLEEVPFALLNRLALFCQPAHLSTRCEQRFGSEEANWIRAEWVRSEFASVDRPSDHGGL